MAIENLDEIINRQSRISSASWGNEWLENASNNYIWQSETVCYTDVTHGSEVWILSAVNGNFGQQQDIAWPTWSGDGKYLTWQAQRHTQAWPDRDFDIDYGVWMIQKADGSYLRPMPNAPNRTAAHNGYFHWSPAVPDTYYMTPLDSNELYEVTISDISEATQLLVAYTGATDNRILLKKALSGDGTKLIAHGPGKHTWIPITVYPQTEAAIDVPDGFTSNRPSYDDYWGDTANRAIGTNSDYHDQYAAGAGSNIWFYIEPENASGTWWRMRPTGPAADGGPEHTNPDHTAPYDWYNNDDTLQPTPGADPGSYNIPWCGDGDTTTDCPEYWGHPCPDRWGRIVVFSQYQVPTGGAFYDQQTHSYLREPPNEKSWTHNDWHAWSDWAASSGQEKGADSPDQEIFTVTYKNGGSRIALCGVHIPVDHLYNSNARPTQSPDGTKIIWHSPFLQEDTATLAEPNLFYVVAYYPYPPEITQCSASGGTVTVRFDWRLDTTEPRAYTDRGWPDEATDDPPAPRETKLFRLWRSSDGTNWTPQGTVNANPFEKWDYVNGGLQSGANSYWEITDSPGDGTWYYAVTSVEHSLLESRTLSNVFTITVSGGSGTGSEDTVYPSNPGADDSFYNTAPTSPQNISYGHQNQTNLNNGQYTITWDAPADTDLIRYYNVYANDGSAPTITQTRRIASVPDASGSAGSFEWIDCFGAIDGTTEYTVTSVDTLGNESSTALAAPTQIQCEGEANPTDVTDSKPEFRAYVAPLSETDPPNITKIQIQVSTSSEFSGTDLEWDSGMLLLDTPLGSEGWTEEIEYEQS